MLWRFISLTVNLGSCMIFVGCALNISSYAKREAILKIIQKDDVLQNGFLLDTGTTFEYYNCFKDVLSLQKLPYHHIWAGDEALLHLIRVGVGLESRVAGDLEIWDQIQSGYGCFKTNKNFNQPLDRVFKMIFGVIQNVRSQSGIDRNLLSLSDLVVETIKAEAGARGEIGILGHSLLAEKIVRHLIINKFQSIKVFSRQIPGDDPHIRNSALSYHSIKHLPVWLNRLDAIVTVAFCGMPLITSHDLELLTKGLLIIDLGVPPNCSKKVYNINRVKYHSLLEIEKLCKEAENVDHEAHIRQAETLISEYFSKSIDPEVYAAGKSYSA